MKPQARKVRDQLTGKSFRTLVDILQDVDDHYRDNPTHGMGCACVDQYVAEVRRQLMHPSRTPIRSLVAVVKWLELRQSGTTDACKLTANLSSCTTVGYKT